MISISVFLFLLTAAKTTFDLLMTTPSLSFVDGDGQHFKIRHRISLTLAGIILYTQER